MEVSQFLNKWPLLISFPSSAYLDVCRPEHVKALEDVASWYLVHAKNVTDDSAVAYFCHVDKPLTMYIISCDCVSATLIASCDWLAPQQQTRRQAMRSFVPQYQREDSWQKRNALLMLRRRLWQLEEDSDNDENQR
jgi:hypothetical protein